MNEKLAAVSNDDLLAIWESLKHVDCGTNEYYDRERDLTMFDWANAVYSEKTARGI